MTRAEFIEIMLRVQSGDRGALSGIYHAYFKKLCATAYSVVRNRDDAYDVASEVLLKLTEFHGDVHSILNPIGYLVRMTRNEAITFLQKKRREVSVAEVYDSAPPGGTDSLWMEDLQRLLSEEEWEMLVRHIIWRESLKKFALRNHLTYATTKRHYAELKRKLREYYKEEK